MILTKRKHFESFRKSFEERTILDGDHCTPRGRTSNFSHSSLRISGVLSARVLLRTLRPTLRGAGDPGCDFGTQTWWGVKKYPPSPFAEAVPIFRKGRGRHASPSLGSTSFPRAQWRRFWPPRRSLPAQAVESVVQLQNERGRWAAAASAPAAAGRHG